jgi:hypothetical protein
LVSNFKEAANRHFKSTQTSQEGAKTKTPQDVDACAVREKTARLKSLRLAEQSAEMETGAKPVTK